MVGVSGWPAGRASRAARDAERQVQLPVHADLLGAGGGPTNRQVLHQARCYSCRAPQSAWRVGVGLQNERPRVPSRCCFPFQVQQASATTPLTVRVVCIMLKFESVCCVPPCKADANRACLDPALATCFAFHTTCGPDVLSIHGRTAQQPISTLLRSRRLTWLGHVGRLADCGPVKQLLFAAAPGAPDGSPPGRARGGPAHTWSKTAHAALAAAFTCAPPQRRRKSWLDMATFAHGLQHRDTMS